MDEKTGKLEIVKEIIPQEERSIRRFNDGGIDVKGRFWLAEIDRKALACGPHDKESLEKYGKPIGRLWRYDPDGSLHLMEDGLACGNGLAWSPDHKTCMLQCPSSKSDGELSLTSHLSTCSLPQRLLCYGYLRIRL
jgi:sugar lactone lactonase YvrE